MSRPSLIERLRRMNQRSLFAPGARGGARLAGRGNEGTDTGEEDISTARQARGEAVQRLQVGLFGIGAMVLLVGLASIIGGQAERNDKLAPPEAAPTTEPMPAPAQANPLADAGVVPDIDAEPSAAPAPPGSPVPPANGAGNGPPAQ